MLNILFAGDLIPPESDNNIYSKELINVLRDKDFSIVNLETPLTGSESSILKTGERFKSTPYAINHIKAGAFDAVALANNHIRDFGNKGVHDTLRTCEDNDIKTVGAGPDIKTARKPLHISQKGQKISILNFCENEFNIAGPIHAGANPYSTISAFYDIQNEKINNDFVFAIYHGGIEYQHYPTYEMIKEFKFLVDVGADCVIAHHTHRYSGIIVYKGKPIIFGLGNFLAPTRTKINEGWLNGVLAKIIIDGTSINYDLIPVRMSEKYSKADILQGEEKKRILNHINEISTTIQDETLLGKYWHNEAIKSTDKLLRIINSNSLFEYRIRKYLPKLFPSRMSAFKLLNLLSLVRGASHRERLIRILEGIYQEKM